MDHDFFDSITGLFSGKYNDEKSDKIVGIISFEKLLWYDKNMETKRLILRKLKMSDAYDIYQNIHHDPKVLETFLCKYCETFEEMDFEKMLRYFENTKSFYYGIELKDTHVCIGMIFENDRIEGNIEIGYAIGSCYWNQGYVSEALEAVLDELKQTNYERIYAGAFKENPASLRVMEKCGMSYSHTIQNEINWHDKMHDVVYYEIVKEKNHD